MSDIERRYVKSPVRQSSNPLTVRQQSTAAGTLGGYAAVFYNPSDPGTEFELSPGIVERLDPHCFDEFLRSSGDVVALWNHDANNLLGRRSSNTLTLRSDATGLRYAVITPATTLGRDLTALVARRDVRGASFGFVADRVTWHEERGLAIRTIESATLVDVSLVTHPAYRATTATSTG